jgi:hypothetical protein
MSLSTLPRHRTRRAATRPPGAPTTDAAVRRRRADAGITVVRRLRRMLRDDGGMSTVEYAIGCVAAAGFAALLYTVITGDSVTAALTQLVQRALTAGF